MSQLTTDCRLSLRSAANLILSIWWGCLLKCLFSCYSFCYSIHVLRIDLSFLLSCHFYWDWAVVIFLFLKTSNPPIEKSTLFSMPNNHLLKFLHRRYQKSSLECNYYYYLWCCNKNRLLLVLFKELMYIFCDEIHIRNVISVKKSLGAKFAVDLLRRDFKCSMIFLKNLTKVLSGRNEVNRKR